MKSADNLMHMCVSAWVAWLPSLLVMLQASGSEARLPLHAFYHLVCLVDDRELDAALLSCHDVSKQEQKTSPHSPASTVRSAHYCAEKSTATCPGAAGRDAP